MIEVRQCRKSFGERLVLDGLQFAVEQGDTYGLLGPNGAGKTTAINILCNLLEADDGTVLINGSPVSEATKFTVGVVPQEISIYKDLTCRENMLFFGKVYGLRDPERTDRVNELVRIFHLEEYARTQVSKMSGGWQRRVNIAVALVHSPGVLILDEPTAGLDVEARYELWELIAGLQSRGVTILLTTHHLDEAERLCSRIGIMRGGRIVAEGSLDELRKLVPARQLAVVETGSEETLLARVSSLGWEHRRYGGRLTLLLPREFSLREIVETLDGVPLTSISLREVGLEHVYMEAGAGMN